MAAPHPRHSPLGKANDRAPRLPQPDVVIPIRLYDNVDGIAGIYRGAEKAFWQAVEAGKIPALHLAPQSEKPPANQRSVRGEQP